MVADMLLIATSLSSLSSLLSLSSLFPLSPFRPYEIDFLSEGVRCGLDMKIARMGSTLTYVPFWLLIERSQMTPYHKKL